MIFSSVRCGAAAVEEAKATMAAQQAAGGRSSVVTDILKVG